ncbi:hypothetical protein CDAR_15541, partial [Caerostris darwini]
ISLAESVSGQDAVSDFNIEERKVIKVHRHLKIPTPLKMADGSVCNTEFISHS